MKKITLLKMMLLAIFVVGSTKLDAQLLIENFNYTVGSTLTTTSTPDPTTGWASHSGNGTANIAVTNGLSFTGYAGSGIGGAANLANNGQDINKSFTAQTTGTIYAAFVISTGATNSAGYFFNMGAATIATTFISRVWVNATGTGVAISGSTAPSSYATITPNTPTLVVVKYDIASKVSSLFVLGTFSATEPASANSTFTETSTLTDVGSVALRQYNAAERVIVDGIRVGTTWAQAVTPSSGTPAATPTFSPAAGTYTSAQSVTLSSTTSGALIYYTTNGVDPTSASTLYTGAINVASTTTVKAIAYDSSNANPSSVATALYTINSATAAETPTFSPAAGTYASAQSVTLSSATSGALIYYTTNGTDPTNANTLYTGAINVASTTTVKAIAYDSSNANPSSVASATYTIAVPTITVTETSIPSMTAIVGETDSETINVSGTNLTENIAISITGTNAAMFSVSPTSITQTGGTATNTLVTITYTPTAAGSHTATLQLTSAGAATVTRTLTGSATFTPLSTPVATAATSVGQTSFTANWETVTGATSYQLNVYTQTTGANATDLFISEYGEGSGGNKKYVEIFNGTGSSVDLSNYTIKKAVNGAGWNASVYSFPTSTSLANNSTYVLANNSTDVLGATEYNSTFVSWNGDDAVGLFKNDVLIDVFGTPNTDPGTGWAVAGTANATVDHIIIRKPSVNSPSTDWTSSAGTTVEDSQWAVSSSTYTTTDQTTNLGSHTMSGGVSTTPVSGSPFTVSAPATSYSVTGLTTSTTYYYDLTASNTNVTTSLSNTINVTTGTGGTGLNNNKIENISAANGKVRFDAIAGESVEIYNSIGQKLINKTAVDGQNTIDLPSLKGIIIVKVGNKTAKVVL